MVSLLGLPMLASLITGLVVYKRFWKGFLKPRLRINQGARIFWGDFHRLSGIWSIWFIALISITGTWFLIQAILADNHVTLTNDGIPPVIARADVPRAAPGQKVPYIELDEAVRLVTGRIPSLEASAVFLPGNAYSPMFVAGRGWYPLMFQSAALNPYTGKIETTRLLSDRTPCSSSPNPCVPCTPAISAVSGVKLIWFVFGLLLSMMVLSGLLIWSKRTAQATAALVKRGKRPARQPKPAKPAPVMANQTAEGQP